MDKKEMMQNLKISIIVPVYKVEAFLDRCVDSIVKQTYHNIEVILVDDGSPDDCPRICDDWALRDGRVVVIHQVNGGLSNARNSGLDAASGEYVLYVDADDYIEPYACEKLLEAGMADDMDIIIGDAFVHRHGRISHIRHRKKIEGITMSGADFLKSEMPINRAHIPVWLRLYRRRFLIDNQLYNKGGRLHEDYEFVPRMLIEAKRVVYTGISFYHYMIRENSISICDNLDLNADHIVQTCKELSKMSDGLEDRKLARIINDFIVRIYLNIFQTAKLHKSESGLRIDKNFLRGKPLTLRNRLKVSLFLHNEKIYYAVNKLFKLSMRNCRRDKLWKKSSHIQ